MNINQLKALDALARYKSFSKAAKSLGVSQPAISIQVRKIQKQFAIKLFWRWGKDIEFSEFGKELVLKARKVIGLLNDIENNLLMANRLESGQLTLGLSCHYFVMEILSIFMKRYPGIVVRAHIGESQTLIDDILACRLDLAEITGTGPDDRLFNLPYSEQSIMILVANNHMWADMPFIHADQLSGKAMVARHTRSMTRHIFTQRLKALDIHPRIVLELDSWETMKEAVVAGIGFGIALEDELKSDGRLKGIPIKGIDLTVRQYFVCLPEFKNLKVVETFLDLVLEIKDLSGERGPCR